MDSGRDGVAAGSDSGGSQRRQDDVESVGDNAVEALGGQDRHRTSDGGTGVSTEHHQSRSGRMSVLGERHGGVRGQLTQTQSNDQGSGPRERAGRVAVTAPTVAQTASNRVSDDDCGSSPPPIPCAATARAAEAEPTAVPRRVAVCSAALTGVLRSSARRDVRADLLRRRRVRKKSPGELLYGEPAASARQRELPC